MRTIIQHIGPLYGEVNTGTVFGQPNGSIAVGQGKAPAPSPDPTPITPANLWTISYSIESGKIGELLMEYVYTPGANPYVICSTPKGNDTGQILKICKVELNSDVPDTSAHMQVQIATDSEFTSMVTVFNGMAGKFATLPSTDFLSKPSFEIKTGTMYYVRLALYDSNGVNLNRYSNTLEMEGVYFDDS